MRRSSDQPTNLDEAEAAIQRVLDSNLQNSVWRCIHKARHELFSLGAVPSDDETRLRTHIAETFDAYRQRHFYPNTPDQEYRYRNLANLLVLAGLAWPVVQTDWRVDRMEESEESLGIRDFAALERHMADRYGRPGAKYYHLHKGPGNGQLMYLLRKGKRKRLTPNPNPTSFAEDTVHAGTQHERPRRDAWVEVGIGDKMYFSLETLLHRFVRPECAENPTVIFSLRVLGTILAKRLREHWFEESRDQGSMIRTEQLKRRIDLNDLFQFLADPDTWVKDDDLFARGKYLTSKEFERDTKAPLSIQSEEWLLRLARWPSWKIDNKLKSKRKEVLNRFLTVITTLQGAMNRVRNIQTIGPDMVKESHDFFVGASSACRNPESIEALSRIIGQSPENLSREQLRAQLILVKEIIMKERKAVQESGKAPPGEDEPAPPERHVLDTLREIFDDRFVDAVKHFSQYEDPLYRTKSPSVDLNQEGPEMYLHHFVQGEFKQLWWENDGGMFRKHSFLLITGVRSDSHENNDEFEFDLTGNVKLLKPGGIIITDGIRRSQTRDYRFEEAARVVQHKPDLRAEVIFDARTHDPLSLIIQRKHPTELPDGFLSPEEKTMLFRDNTYCRSVGDVIRLRPNLTILNTIRHNIIELAGGNVDIFNNLHDKSTELVNRALVRMVSSSLAHTYNLFDDTLLEQVRESVRSASLSSGDRQKLYGTQLDRSMQPRGARGTEDLYDKDFYKMLNNFLRYFGAAHDDPEIRETYARILEEVMTKSLTERVLLPGESVAREQGGQQTLSTRNEMRRLLLDEACNVSYASEPLLGKTAINQITKAVGDALRQTIQQSPAHPADWPVLSGLESLDPQYLHAIPRLGDPDSWINTHCLLLLQKVADNSEFGLDTSKQLLRQKISRLKVALSKLSSCGIPLTVIRFAECPTNIFLLDLLKKLLGEDAQEFIHPINISFDRREDAAERIRHMNHVGPKLKQSIDRGGMFLIGGSYRDAYDDHGEFFKTHVAAPLCERLLDSRAPVRAFGICFGDQTMSDELAVRLGMDAVVTRPGALEFCPSVVHVEEKGHPLFLDCPPRFTLAQTHSGHICGLDSRSASMKIRPIATSELTGNAIACSALDNRFIGIQAHPEIELLSRQQRHTLMSDLGENEADLQRIFGVSSKDIDGMWQKAVDGIRAEAGSHILINGLLFHAESLRGKTGRA